MAKNTGISRSTKGLNDVLFEEIQAVRTGTSNPQRAREISKLVNSIVSVTKLEMDMHRFVGEETKSDKTLKAIEI